jgi:DNA modification methylase
VADLLLTDPPYGELVIMKKGHVGKSNAAKTKDYGDNYQNEGDFDLEPVLDAAKGLYKLSVIWGGNYFTHLLSPRTSWIVWDKRAGEHCWYSDCELAWSDLPIPAKLFQYTWQGMIRQGEKEEKLHPTQKPVALMDWILKELAKDCRVVLDLFSGSGVVLAACENTGRIGRAIELSPAYVAVTLERLSKMGLEPVLSDQ